jgi:hypothetical protein
MSKIQGPHLPGLNSISGHSFLRPPWGLPHAWTIRAKRLGECRSCCMKAHERGVRYTTERAESTGPLTHVPSRHAQDSRFYLEEDGIGPDGKLG